jgi:UDP:flavonoid glycosyltransferase YjiC (YdhE family)
MNALRKQYGMSDLGGNLQAVYTDADVVCYCDLPSLFHLHEAPASHRIIGPLIWSPAVSVPSWWEGLPENRPLAYLSLGSSGRADLAMPAANALVAAGFAVMMSTAGAAINAQEDAQKDSIFQAPMLPGLDACRRADIVVCNGGSPTTQQALTAGKPVIGIPSNLDQFLNMQALQVAGVGRTVRADRFSQSDLEVAARELAQSEAIKARVASMTAEAESFTSDRVAESTLKR